MRLLLQMLSVTWIGLRSVPLRFGTSMIVVVGVATVVAVFVSTLALAAGFERAAARGGSPERVIVLGGGANTESDSALTRANASTIADAPGIRRSAGGDPVVSAEVLAFVPVSNRRTGLNAFVSVRGIGRQGMMLRPEVSLADGRVFQPGLREVIVGRAAQQRIGGLEIGSRITLPQGDWTVVGVFTSEGDARESELLTDAETLLTEYRRQGFNSMTVALEEAAAFDRFRSALTTDPTLSVQVIREDEYLRRAAEPMARLLRAVAYGIGGIMAFGTVFGVLNTMYAAVSARAREIATLRALGFAPGAVVTSVVIEALLLALSGALMGALLASLIVNGASVSTMTGITPSQITFDLELRAPVVALGILVACLIGATGGLFGSIRASRIPVATAMRATWP